MVEQPIKSIARVDRHEALRGVWSLQHPVKSLRKTSHALSDIEAHSYLLTCSLVGRPNKSPLSLL